MHVINTEDYFRAAAIKIKICYFNNMQLRKFKWTNKLIQDHRHRVLITKYCIGIQFSRLRQ